ncbi:transcription initiation factor IIA subunit 1-like [Ostrea edulis]|uniref:transcription initiation factor IIA subunit 1-like n=1 Tax=Ostrea edulis TaxID=37623 RepID=UPI0020953940|nr:transcription initiation factor IIA subunit 1-like [Ostrea edulis]
MASSNPVPRLYKTVVEDVISNVREAFLDEGVDEQVLQELKQLWENKLQQSRALDSGPEPSEQVMIPSTIQYIPQPVQSAPAKQQFIGASGVVTQNMPVPVQIASQDISQPAAAAHMALPQGVFQQQLQALASQGLTLQPTGNGQFIIQALPQQAAHGQQIGGHQLQQVTISQASIPTMIQQPQPQQQQQKTHQVLQLDGAGDSSSSEDEDFDDDDDDNENDDDVKEEDNDEQGEEEEPLNSDDDVSDDDPSDLFDTDNVVVCQYDKINRNKNKWKFHLKDGIMNLNGKDFVFQKATGDAEW